RRRHTRWPRDWSSDVCSSDLSERVEHHTRIFRVVHRLGWAGRIGKSLDPDRGGMKISRWHTRTFVDHLLRDKPNLVIGSMSFIRSEERRVGKDMRTGGGSEQE